MKQLEFSTSDDVKNINFKNVVKLILHVNTIDEKFMHSFCSLLKEHGGQLRYMILILKGSSLDPINSILKMLGEPCPFSKIALEIAQRRNGDKTIINDSLLKLINNKNGVLFLLCVRDLVYVGHNIDKYLANAIQGDGKMCMPSRLKFLDIGICTQYGELTQYALSKRAFYREIKQPPPEWGAGFNYTPESIILNTKKINSI